MTIEIKNETVYVIYYQGIPFKSSGRKLIYTSKGAAKGVITNEVNDPYINRSMGDFKIVEYGPKEEF